MTDSASSTSDQDTGSAGDTADPLPDPPVNFFSLDFGDWSIVVDTTIMEEETDFEQTSSQIGIDQRTSNQYAKYPNLKQFMDTLKPDMKSSIRLKLFKKSDVDTLLARLGSKIDSQVKLMILQSYTWLKTLLRGMKTRSETGFQTLLNYVSVRTETPAADTILDYMKSKVEEPENQKKYPQSLEAIWNKKEDFETLLFNYISHLYPDIGIETLENLRIDSLAIIGGTDNRLSYSLVELSKQPDTIKNAYLPILLTMYVLFVDYTINEEVINASRVFQSIKLPNNSLVEFRKQFTANMKNTLKNVAVQMKTYVTDTLIQDLKSPSITLYQQVGFPNDPVDYRPLIKDFTTRVDILKPTLEALEDKKETKKFQSVLELYKSYLTIEENKEFYDENCVPDPSGNAMCDIKEKEKESFFKKMKNNLSEMKSKAVSVHQSSRSSPATSEDEGEAGMAEACPLSCPETGCTLEPAAELCVDDKAAAKEPYCQGKMYYKDIKNPLKINKFMNREDDTAFGERCQFIRKELYRRIKEKQKNAGVLVCHGTLIKRLLNEHEAKPEFKPNNVAMYLMYINKKGDCIGYKAETGYSVKYVDKRALLQQYQLRKGNEPVQQTAYNTLYKGSRYDSAIYSSSGFQTNCKHINGIPLGEQTTLKKGLTRLNNSRQRQGCHILDADAGDIISYTCEIPDSLYVQGMEYISFLAEEYNVSLEGFKRSLGTISVALQSLNEIHRLLNNGPLQSPFETEGDVYLAFLNLFTFENLDDISDTYVRFFMRLIFDVSDEDLSSVKKRDKKGCIPNEQADAAQNDQAICPVKETTTITTYICLEKVIRLVSVFCKVLQPVFNREVNADLIKKVVKEGLEKSKQYSRIDPLTNELNDLITDLQSMTPDVDRDKEVVDSFYDEFFDAIQDSLIPVILIRHGQSGNQEFMKGIPGTLFKSKERAGQDSPLSVEGEKQVEERKAVVNGWIKTNFEGKNIVKFVSPLLRARQTARILFGDEDDGCDDIEVFDWAFEFRNSWSDVMAPQEIERTDPGLQTNAKQNKMSKEELAAELSFFKKQAEVFLSLLEGDLSNLSKEFESRKRTRMNTDSLAEFQKRATGEKNRLKEWVDDHPKTLNYLKQRVDKLNGMYDEFIAQLKRVSLTTSLPEGTEAVDVDGSTGYNCQFSSFADQLRLLYVRSQGECFLQKPNSLFQNFISKFSKLFGTQKQEENYTENSKPFMEQSFNYQDAANHLRTVVTEEMEKKKKKDKLLRECILSEVSDVSEYNDEQKIVQYIQDMKTERWGDHCTLSVLSMLYDVEVVVFDKLPGVDSSYTKIHINETGKDNCVVNLVRESKSSGNEHYTSLREKSGTTIEPSSNPSEPPAENVELESDPSTESCSLKSLAQTLNAIGSYNIMNDVTEQKFARYKPEEYAKAYKNLTKIVHPDKIGSVESTCAGDEEIKAQQTLEFLKSEINKRYGIDIRNLNPSSDLND